ncbi:MAG: hypothetical protein ACT4QC_05195 [Planctomycetaceae bacterium]
MSEPASAAHGAPAESVPHVHAKTGSEVSTPAFDRDEIKSFGADDGHAVTVIGKMLVGFFFYSLVVMALVAWLTFLRVGQQPDVHAAGTHHSADADDF